MVLTSSDADALSSVPACRVRSFWAAVIVSCKGRRWESKNRNLPPGIQSHGTRLSTPPGACRTAAAVSRHAASLSSIGLWVFGVFSIFLQHLFHRFVCFCIVSVCVSIRYKSFQITQTLRNKYIFINIWDEHHTAAEQAQFMLKVQTYKTTSHLNQSHSQQMLDLVPTLELGIPKYLSKRWGHPLLSPAGQRHQISVHRVHIQIQLLLKASK